MRVSDSTLCSYLLDGKLQWEEEAHVDRDNSNEVILCVCVCVSAYV